MSQRYNNVKINTTQLGKYIYDSSYYPKIDRKDTDIYIITKRGDRMDLLSHKYYGDSRYWWIIALANDIINVAGLV